MLPRYLPVLIATAILTANLWNDLSVAQAAEEAAKAESVTWAEIELKGSLPEGPQVPGLFEALSESLTDVTGRLDKAAADDSIEGVVLRISSPQVGWGKLNELRAAIGRVRKAGKKVYGLTEMGTAKDYLLATACDEIIMPESGVLLMTGLRAEVTFYRNLFDLLGIKPDMLQVGEYKGAAEPYMRTSMSPELRREMESILTEYYRQMVEMIAESRSLTAEQVKAAIDSGPHTAAAARELKLIDRLAYEDELEQLIRGDRAGLEVTFDSKYGKKKLDTDFSGLTGMIRMMNLMMGVEQRKRETDTPKIAVIYATGVIMSGKSSTSPLGTQVLGDKTIIKAVEKAAEDKSVKAIVLRVDSPGGSALASDLMWRALQKCGKPVVVSMGDVAASGGYYISMGATTIFAEPGTLTGSIGVVGGKLGLKGLFQKVGITTDVISLGQNSGALSPLDGFSDSERKAMQTLLNAIYRQFTEKAAKGRKMEYDTLEKLARGRVYTGTQAKEAGLVDELGTLDDAVKHAQRLAGLKADDSIERMNLPKPQSPFEQLFGPLDAAARQPGAANPLQANTVIEAAAQVAPSLAGQLELLQLIDRLSADPRLTLLPFQIQVR
ncbi:MAG: signal peptide peptidase SppA [Planctomycetaceae bacterium]|nr:signal peptide peptidase SppA [Planctomycetaceae bacterium]